MKKSLLFLATILLSVTIHAQAEKKEIKFNSSDNITITGDLYLTSNLSAPFIILFHQAGYSRGEYIETAPKLNKLGFNCLAIDQRSGKGVNDIPNETNMEASKKGLSTKYPDAMPDLEAAIKYVEENYKPKKLIILGSSYSSSLSLVLAAKYPDKIDAALAFSPGEYFLFEDKKMEEYASKIKIPVFLTSAKSEEHMWKSIFEKIPEAYSTGYLPEVEGIHGSRALWEKIEGNEGYWEAVKGFLNKL